jgi:ferredoxin
MVKVIEEKCAGCGTCAAICPKAFKMNSKGKAEVISQDCDCIEDAKNNCPLEAIVD